MIEVDYIVVGLGIAGITLCEVLENQNKTFIAIDSGRKGATFKSGGVLNPTVLKRFNMAWNSNEFYSVAMPFYKELAAKLNNKPLFQEMPIIRIFKSVEEQNDWSVASDKREMQQFLSSEYLPNENPSIRADLGFGEVRGTARIDTKGLLNLYIGHLLEYKRLLVEEFHYKKLVATSDKVEYGNITARQIIFCEGAKAVDNPFFPRNAIIPNKGEYLIIKAPQLNLNRLLKGSLYIIPLGNSLYKVGGTFSRDEISTIPTAEAKEEILLKMESMINCPFEIVGQTAGIRPTTRDRKPLLGNLPENPQIYFFNGLGSRGFTMAPLLSKILYRNLAQNIPIPKEIDIRRIK